jgi:uncharacterized membrane protein YdjX (TVP38/TMEM64 family)
MPVPNAQRPRSRHRAVLLALALALAVLAVARLGVAHRERLPLLAEWVRGAGALGVAAYVAAYGLGAVLFMPAAVMSATAGYLYGPVKGVLVASPANLFGATLTFLVGRALARRWKTRRAPHPRLAAVDAALGEQGARIIALLRLSPVLPHNVLNYALALSRVRLRDYVIGTLLGMAPLTCAQVYAGSLATSVADLLSGRRVAGPWSWLLTLGGLATTAVAVVALTRAARRALARTLPAVAEPAATQLDRAHR